jgi:hypothetical protein
MVELMTDSPTARREGEGLCEYASGDVYDGAWRAGQVRKALSWPRSWPNSSFL